MSRFDDLVHLAQTCHVAAEQAELEQDWPRAANQWRATAAFMRSAVESRNAELAAELPDPLAVEPLSRVVRRPAHLTDQLAAIADTYT